jgi:hypothetical protein
LGSASAFKSADRPKRKDSDATFLLSRRTCWIGARPGRDGRGVNSHFVSAFDALSGVFHLHTHQ